MAINDRIRQIRAAGGFTLRQFAERIGISDSAVSQIEKGKSGVSDQTVRFICKEFGIREEWLRTGEGEMRADGCRALEVQAQVERLFADDGAKFQQALVAALLQFDPSGPQWRVVEDIFYAVVAQLGDAADPKAGRAAMHEELDRQLDLEKGDAGESSA